MDLPLQVRSLPIWGSLTPTPRYWIVVGHIPCTYVFRDFGAQLSLLIAFRLAVCTFVLRFSAIT